MTAISFPSQAGFSLLFSEEVAYTRLAQQVAGSSEGASLRYMLMETWSTGTFGLLAIVALRLGGEHLSAKWSDRAPQESVGYLHWEGKHPCESSPGTCKESFS